MVDVEARNAVIAMVMHLMSAFKTPARPRAPQVFPPACATQLPQPSVHGRGSTPLVGKADDGKTVQIQPYLEGFAAMVWGHSRKHTLQCIRHGCEYRSLHWSQAALCPSS